MRVSAPAPYERPTVIFGLLFRFWLAAHLKVFQKKSLMSIKFSPAILGLEMAARILWAPGISWRFLHLVLGVWGVFWVSGGGEVPILFVFPELRGTYWTFWPPPRHVEDPPPHQDILTRKFEFVHLFLAWCELTHWISKAESAEFTACTSLISPIPSSRFVRCLCWETNFYHCWCWHVGAQHR